MKLASWKICLPILAAGLVSLRAADPSPAPLTPTNMDEVPSMGEDRASFLVQPVRELYKFCLDAAAHHRDGAKVDQILEVIESAQDKDPASRTYGNFRWRADEPKVDDQNSVEFAMQSAISLWTLYRDALSKESQDRVQRMILLAVEGIKRHEVKISYTNMALMKIQNQTLIGEAFNQPALVEEAGRSMDLWLKETATNGIHEYVSPTYYGTDFDSLGLLARFAKDPDIRRKALAGIRAIWIDIAANWFAPCRRLSGSHARDYDVLHSRGYLDVQLLGAGWITREESTQKGQSEFAKLCQVPLPDDIRTMFKDAVPRTVVRRWGPEPEQGTVNYVGAHFALGTGGNSLDPEDMTLVLDLGAPQTPVSRFMMDGRGDAYGVKKVTEGSHRKNPHLKPFLATVQRGSEALYLAVQPNDAKIEQISSNFIFPADAQLWTTDGEAPSGLSVEDSKPVFIRTGDVAVGLRFVTALNTASKPVKVTWETDGKQLGLQRLACIQSDVGNHEGKAVTGLWIRAGENLDDKAFSTFRKDFAAAAETTTLHEGHLTITAAGKQGELGVGANLANLTRDVPRGGEPDWGKVVMAVNGHDYFADLIAR